jgi:hypothetical protein
LVLGRVGLIQALDLHGEFNMALRRAAPMKRLVVKRSVKKVARKAPARAAKKVAALPRSLPGHHLTAGGILVPERFASGIPVKADKLKDGIGAANKKISELVQEIVDTATTDYTISEIELTASFNAEGKFMGFGVGGEVSIVIKIKPVQV